MNTSYPTEAELADAIESAARMAINDLFAQHPGHYFYYVSLITSGEAHPPVLTAWSKEALEDAVKDEVDKEDARWGLEWSYGESPFFCFGEPYFQEVKDLFARRPDMNSLMWDESAWNAECELRLHAMEAAMSRLNEEGLFGTGQDRFNVVVNVEVMPPDYTNTQRAKRLNPPEAIRTWLAEVAEREDGDV